MSQSNRTRTGGISLVRVLLAAIACISLAYVLLTPIIFHPRPALARRVVCMANVRQLGVCLALYANDHNDVYPCPERWCDAVTDVFGPQNQGMQSAFCCRGAKGGPCDYAMNPHATSRQASDVVLLFESKPGWNQSGGPELLTTENHLGKGCTVLFTDQHVEFVKTQDLRGLKWDYADSSQSNQSVPSRDN